MTSSFVKAFLAFRHLFSSGVRTMNGTIDPRLRDLTTESSSDRTMTVGKFTRHRFGLGKNSRLHFWFSPGTRICAPDARETGAVRTMCVRVPRSENSRRVSQDVSDGGAAGSSTRSTRWHGNTRTSTRTSCCPPVVYYYTYTRVYVCVCACVRHRRGR